MHHFYTNANIMAIKIYTSFFLLSLVMIYFAYKHYANTQDLLLMGKKTKGRVIKMVVSRSDDGYTYAPVFEYQANGQTKTYKSTVSSSPPAYAEGDIVSLVFDDSDGEVKIISFWGLYRWSVILLMMASPIFILCGSYLLYTKSWI